MKIFINKRKIYNLVLFLIAVLALVPTEVYPSETLQCSPFEAVYKPHADSWGTQGLDFALTIEDHKTSEWRPGSVEAVFKLHTYDKTTGNVLSILSLPYLCTASGHIFCFIQISGTKTKIYVTALNKDFSRHLGGPSSSELASYAIVFPNISEVLNYLNWDDITEVKYFTKQKVHPTGGTPVVWLLNNCKN